jgi:hypothetical protein
MKSQRARSSLRAIPFVRPLLLVAACGVSGALHAATAPGAPAGPPQRHNLITSGAQEQASIASDAQGGAVAVWYSAPAFPAPQGVRARRIDVAGAPYGSEIVVNSTPLYGSIARPEVAADRDGNFSVVWTNLGAAWTSLPHVYRRRFDAAGNALGAETRLDDLSTNEAGTATIAMNASGASVVAWYAYGGGTHVRARRYDAAGVAIGSEITVATMATTNYGPQIRVALDDAGRFTVVWTEDKNNGANFDVFRRRYDATGTAQGLAQRVNSAITGPQRKADIAMDAAGNSVVIWDSLPSSNNVRIVGQRYDSAGFAAGGEFVLAYQWPGAASHAAVTMARASGDFAATWHRADGQIYLRRYAANGTAYGDEAVVPSAGTGPTYPRLASDSDGDLSLIWRDKEGTSSNDYGVMGRRYAGQASIDLGADLSGSIDASTAPATLEYRLDVQNLRPATAVPGVGSASGIVALVNPPADSTLLSAAGVNWYCDTGAGVPRCTYLAPLAAGAVAAPLIVRVSAGANPSPVASVQVSGNQYDAVTANDADAVVLNLP